MPSSPSLEARVRDRAHKLERAYRHLIGCRVVIEAPSRSHIKGGLFSVNIDLVVPGAELVINRGSSDHSHEDAFVAIRDAFDAARRRLEDFARRRRGDVKLHERFRSSAAVLPGGGE